MLKVYSHNSRFMVFQVKQLLDDKGIPCFVKNEFAIGAMGELSPMDVLPEVWINDPEWLPQAQACVQAFSVQQGSNSTWLCSQCQEQNAGNFELCWQCGHDSIE
ncbi:putative signal transducing protein [Paraglaciecola aestuariivivens]